MPTPPYLLIAGTPKSGTTSLFQYLATHPQICAANRKETYFFAREFDFANVCDVPETLEGFNRYFKHARSDSALRLEATPYTLYARDAAQKMRHLLPNVTLLFILRDPVERFLSDYQFHIQREHNGAQRTLEQFIQRELKSKGKLPSLLQLGRYYEYLVPFWESFTADRIGILTFEDLLVNPKREMQKLCARLGIDSAPYDAYIFDSHNRTIQPRSAQLNRASMKLEPVVARVRARIRANHVAHQLFERVVRVSKNTYLSINDRGKHTAAPIAAQTRAQLDTYYFPHTEKLFQALGRELPWKSYTRELASRKGEQPIHEPR